MMRKAGAMLSHFRGKSVAEERNLVLRIGKNSLSHPPELNKSKFTGKLIIADNIYTHITRGQGAKSYPKMLSLHCVSLQHFGNPEPCGFLRQSPEPPEAQPEPLSPRRVKRKELLYYEEENTGTCDGRHHFIGSLAKQQSGAPDEYRFNNGKFD